MKIKTRKTKIVVTVGAQRGGNGDTLFDPDGNKISKRISHGQLLTWFIDAGADVFRFNMSFADKSKTYGANEKTYLDRLKANKDQKARKVSVLGDLPGPKLRLSEVRAGTGVSLKENQSFFLYFGSQPIPDDADYCARVTVNGKPFEGEVQSIDDVSDIGAYMRSKDTSLIKFAIGDGQVRLAALDEEEGVVQCKITKGERITEGKKADPQMQCTR